MNKPSRRRNFRRSVPEVLETRRMLDAKLPTFDYAPSEVVVQFALEATPAERGLARALVGGTVKETLHTNVMKSLGAQPIERISLAPGLEVADAVARLQKNPLVSLAEPNFVYQPAAISDDPYYTNGQLWGMYSSDSPTAIGPAGTTNQYGSQAEVAWNQGITGSAEVYVGIIDEGVQYTHPDLVNNMWVNPYETPGDGVDNDGNGYIDDIHGWDFFYDDASVYDSGEDAHGTHVAGTIGGDGGNAIGVAGVNWDVTMISAKFLGPGGGYTTDAVAAVDYLTDLKLRHGINIVTSNNSWGGGGYSQALHDAIIRGAKADILFIAAAGNGNNDNDASGYYPSNYDTSIGTPGETAASYDAVISVAAIDSTGAKSYFGSSTSASSYGLTTVDLAAPGSGIWSSVPTNSYSSYNGTSMATPHVAGAAALYASAAPAGLTGSDLKAAILDNVAPTSSMSNITVTGGRLDVAEMLTNLTSVQFDQAAYGVPSSALLTVSDPGANLNDGIAETVSVTVSSTSESSGEVVVLTETGNATGRFQATVSIVPGSPVSDGLLQAANGDVLTVDYSALGLQDTAVVDTNAPVITNIVASPNALSSTITWNTDEPSTSVVHYGLAADNLASESSSASLVLDHSVKLIGLNPQTTYFYQVTSGDSLGYTSSSAVQQFTTPAAEEILLVDDDEGATTESFFQTALDANGLNYNNWDVAAIGGTPSASDLQNYSVVVWNTGFNFEAAGSGLTPSEQSAIASYLDAGGRIMISGQDILYGGVDAAFQTDYLKTQSYTSDLTTLRTDYDVSGAPENSLGSGQSLDVNKPSDYPYIYLYPDAVTPTSDAEGAYLHSDPTASDPYSAISYRGDYAGGGFGMIFFALPFEGISTSAADPNNQNEVMRRSINFLRDSSTPEVYLATSSTAELEGDSGSSARQYHVTLSRPSATTINVDWSTAGSGGSPADGADFAGGSFPSETVVFEPGVTTVPVAISVVGDVEIEPDESFVTTLDSVSGGAVLSVASVTGQILADDARLAGQVWHDLDENSVADTGEPGYSGIRMYLDIDNNAQRDAGEPFVDSDLDGNYFFDIAPGSYLIRAELTAGQLQTFPYLAEGALEPDDYAAGTLLNDELSPAVTLTAVGNLISNPNVTSGSATYNSTGARSFYSSWNGGRWNTNDAELRIDFSGGVSNVSIDFVSDDSSDFGHLRAYNGTGTLLEEYVTADLGTGVSETMSISRLTNEISYVLASGRNGQHGWLDNLSFASIATGEAPPLAVTVGPEIATGLDFGVTNTVDPNTPTAVADSYQTEEDTPLVVPASGLPVSGVLANDSDPNGDTLSAVLVSGTSDGTLSLNADGSFSYTPNANFHGSDSFSYRASDGVLESSPVIVDITINAVNDAPVANPDGPYTVVKNVPLTVSVANGVLTNDTDIEGDTLTASIEVHPTHGSVTLNSDGSFTYTPALNYLGSDSFSYRAADAESSSAPVEVTLQVVPVPGITVGSPSGDSGEDGTSATFTLVLDTQPTGDVTINLSSSDLSEGTVSPASVVFPASEWSVPLTVTVTGVDDFVVDGDQLFTIVTSPAVSSDPDYNGLNAADVNLSNLDNDSPFETKYVAVSGAFTPPPADLYNTLPLETGDFTNTTEKDAPDGSYQVLTEGAMQLLAESSATADVPGEGAVSGSYLDTVAIDGVSQQINEIQSKGGKPSNRYTYLSHGWQFGNITANTLHMKVELSGSESEAYQFEYAVDGVWTTLETEVTASGTYEFPAIVDGSVELRVSDTTREPGNRGINSLLIDYLAFEGNTGVTSAIDSDFVWEFTDVETAQNFHLVGYEDDLVDDFQFEYSDDGGVNWNSLGPALSGGTADVNIVMDVDFSAAPLTAQSVLVRVYDTNRDNEVDPRLGSVYIDQMYFLSSQTDLRTPVDVFASGPAQEDNDGNDVPAVFTFSRPDDGDLSKPLTVSFDVTGTASSSDYTQTISGTSVTIPALSASETVTFTPTWDLEAEGTETIVVTLLDSDVNPFRPGFSPSATADLLDDDLLIYKPIGEINVSGSITSGSWQDLLEEDGVTETVTERESGGKPANRYTFVEHIYEFGAVDNVRSFRGVVTTVVDNPADKYELQYSFDQQNWSRLGNQLVDGTSTVSVDVNFESPIVTTGNNTLQVRLVDIDRTPGERQKGSVTLDYLAFSTLPSSTGGAAASVGDSITGAEAESVNGDDQVKSSGGVVIVNISDSASSGGAVEATFPKSHTRGSDSLATASEDELRVAPTTRDKQDAYFATLDVAYSQSQPDGDLLNEKQVFSDDPEEDLLDLLAADIVE